MKPLIFLLPAVLSLHAAAQNYVIADDRLSSGVLTLEGSNFSVSTVNPNGNVCDYEGIVRNRIASDGEGSIVKSSPYRIASPLSRSIVPNRPSLHFEKKYLKLLSWR